MHIELIEFIDIKLRFSWNSSNDNLAKLSCIEKI